MKGRETDIEIETERKREGGDRGRDKKTDKQKLRVDTHISCPETILSKHDTF